MKNSLKYENNNYLFNIMKKISNEKKERENKNNLSFNFKSIFSKNGKFLSNSNLNESNIFIKEFSNSFNKNLIKNNKNILNKNKILFKEKINEIFKEDQNKNENKNKKKKKIKLKFNRNLNKYLNSTKCSSGFLSKREINNKNIENYDIFKVAIYQKKCDEYLNKFNK